MRTFTIEPRGPFSLAAARDFAGGFAAGIGSQAAVDGSILMTFPVEGWTAAAAVQVRQAANGSIHGDVFGDGDLATIERQAARSLSLDHDGRGWPEVGLRDPAVGGLPERYGLLRPVCFFSAYEAATSFVIGQRISMAQTRRVKERLAEAAGDTIEVEVSRGDVRADGHDRRRRDRPRVNLVAGRRCDLRPDHALASKAAARLSRPALAHSRRSGPTRMRRRVRGWRRA